MIELTEQQRTELNDTPLLVIDPHTKEEYIIVRREVYQRLQGMRDVVLATGELVDKVMAEDDANDPYLQSYQSVTRKVSP